MNDTRPWATPLWLALGAAALTLQAVAVATGSTDSKLSRHVERLRVHAIWRAPLAALWAWLTWHWFVEPRWLPRLRRRGLGAGDGAVPAAAAAAAWTTRSRAQEAAPWPRYVTAARARQ